MTLNATGVITIPAKAVRESLVLRYPLQKNLVFQTDLKSKDGRKTENETLNRSYYPIMSIQSVTITNVYSSAAENSPPQVHHLHLSE